MKIKSLMTDGWKFRPVEIEVALAPGVPAVNVTGLPDLPIRESVARLRSAFRSQGFAWPRTKQIFINLRPSHVRKCGAGLELAIAVALLAATDQYKAEPEALYYGSLGLDGSLGELDEVRRIRELQNSQMLITGPVRHGLHVPAKVAATLYELVEGQTRDLPAQSVVENMRRPEFPPMNFSGRVAELMVLVGAGGHSVMLAGPAGSGKSTFAESVAALSPPPDEEIFKEAWTVAQWRGEELHWRPVAAPHHTIPSRSMVGGGFPVYPGEISRAHGGFLLMDEFLEFKPDVQEALREPMEKGVIRLSRKGEYVEMPARFQLVGTTNLCPCGELVPLKSRACPKSLVRCRSHLERLSGPILDRFDILEFTHLWGGEKTISSDEIRQRIQSAWEFRFERGQERLNGELQLEDLRESLDEFTRDYLLPGQDTSMRRHRALLRVARSYADMERSPRIELRHIRLAESLSLQHMRQLKEIFS